MSDVGGALFREGLMTLASVGGPLFAVLFVTGLALGIAQAATQVNDAAVGFLPRLAGAVLVLLALGGWMVERFAAFLRLAFERMAQGG